jgi:hypothetical protein
MGKNVLRALVITAATLGIPACAAAQAIAGAATGLSGSYTTVTFEEAVLGTGTAVTNQFAAYGVSFSPSLYYDTGAQVFFPDHHISNFPGTGGEVDPFSIFFTTAVTGAAFNLITNDATTTQFRSYLAGSLVDQFTAGTDYFSPLGRWYGFENSMFDEIQVEHITGTYASLQLDNIQIASDGPTSTVPEPVTMILLGSGLAGVGIARRRMKGSAQS